MEAPKMMTFVAVIKTRADSYDLISDALEQEACVVTLCKMSGDNILHAICVADSMVEMNNFAWRVRNKYERWNERHRVPSGFTLVFGHTPTCYFQQGEPIRIWRGDDAIGIDCACGYYDGRLGCLRLDDMQEFYSLGEYPL